MSDLYGLIPCAGRQTRMKELTFAKELLPLFDGRPVVQHSIDCLRRATPHITAIVNPNKKDLIRYFNQQSVTVIEYPGSKGPMDTIFHGAKKLGGDFLFCLSDTYYRPENTFIRLKDAKAPNVLGLFHSTTPERFDSVKTDTRLGPGQVTTYASKVTPAISPWVMGCGKLSLKTHRYFKDTGTEQIFDAFFQTVIKKDELYGLKLKDSSFYDLGTPDHYIEYLLNRFPPA